MDCLKIMNFTILYLFIYLAFILYSYFFNIIKFICKVYNYLNECEIDMMGKKWKINGRYI